MSIHPQMSVRMASAYPHPDGGFVQMKATLDGRTLTLRAGLFTAVKVDLDELKRAIDALESAMPKVAS